MKIEMNLDKKHIYIISGLIAVFMLIVFAAAAVRNPGHTYRQIDFSPVLDIAEGPNKVTVNGDLFVAGKISSPSLIVCPLQTCVELAADYNHCTCGGACTGGFVISGGGDCRTNGWVVESRPSAVDTWVLACNDLIAMQKPNNFYILCGKLGG